MPLSNQWHGDIWCEEIQIVRKDPLFTGDLHNRVSEAASWPSFVWLHHGAQLDNVPGDSYVVPFWEEKI